MSAPMRPPGLASRRRIKASRRMCAPARTPAAACAAARRAPGAWHGHSRAARRATRGGWVRHSASICGQPYERSRSPHSTSVGCWIVARRSRPSQPSIALRPARAACSLARSASAASASKAGDCSRSSSQVALMRRAVRCAPSSASRSRERDSVSKRPGMLPCALVAYSTSRCTRAGARCTICWTTMPPIEWPSRWKRCTPRWSSVASTARACVSIASGACRWLASP